jgi:diguanylate cyclase (GGDEF)-like protein
MAAGLPKVVGEAMSIPIGLDYFHWRATGQGENSMKDAFEPITTEYHLLRDAVQSFFVTLHAILPVNTFFVAARKESSYLILSALNSNETLVQEGATLALPVTGKLGRCSFLGIPIVLQDGRQFGQICALDRQHAFTREDSKLLERMADLISRLIEVEESVIYDDLTGVYRRKYMEALFYNLPLETGKTVIFMDLDDFKNINDTYGHDTGDEVLKRIGAILNEVAAVHGAMPCRYAGDEFLLVIPNRNQDLAMEAVEHLMERLTQPFEVNRQQLHVTASIGVCVEADSLQEYIQRADSAMYQVKRDTKQGVRVFAG